LRVAASAAPVRRPPGSGPAGRPPGHPDPQPGPRGDALSMS